MKHEYLSLADIGTGECCYIVKVHGYGSFRNRVLEMGFISGEEVRVVKNAPFHDPVEYIVMNTHVSLRRSEAAMIEVVSHAERVDASYNGTFVESVLHAQAKERGKRIEVALVGNPNSGKTSLFNRITGLREHVGNYSGVTVDAKRAEIKHGGYTLEIVDLPGTYSITEYSAEEKFVRDYLTKQHPDIVLNVVDAGKLERNLFLTTQLIDMNLWVVMALNLYDELEQSGDSLDFHKLGHLLGFPIVPTVATKGEGLIKLLDTVIEAYEGRADEMRHIHINYGTDIEGSISQIKPLLEPFKDQAVIYAPRYQAIKALEDESNIDEMFAGEPKIDKLKRVAAQEREKLEKDNRLDIKSIFANAKYGFIRGALSETMKQTKRSSIKSDYIDKILTHSWLGYPCLLLFLWLTFQATYYIGNFPMEWIDAGVSWLAEWTKGVLPEGPLNDLITDGIITGVGGVLVFLPNILILFFFISLMEDTGYMARAAFLMDKLMHKMGLHGKSFIPLLMGFGCNVPAVMATRTLESRRDRILTTLVVPFMSCSARLPILLLLVGAFFDKHQGLVLLSLYLISILLGILTAWVLGKTMLKQESDPFVMELPPYRIPTARNMFLHMWDKGKQYLKKMSTVILFASIVIWALGYFPRPEADMTPSEQMEQSYIGKIGKTIEPVMEPLGFDWKMDVSILTGLMAKEVVVSSLGILYHNDDSEDGLAEKLQENSGFTPIIAYGFMLFMMLYVPCIATIVAISKEAGRKWATFSVIYGIILAWVVAFLVYQVGSTFI
ncbi:MAG: ferrous iron transport protein B [Bacteroidales bacterium]|nr:ferrous iron transport protein B [Bacteroidales bacterium]